ncbi:MAG: CotH kinase family protein [Clostridiales bacterium]|nr:CotH kinase family protein [Clostridiales bacterium]
MIAHKHITKIIAAGMAAAVCLCLCAAAFSGPIAAAAGETGITMAYETALFDTSSVLEVNIRMDEADWNDMLANAAAEEYYQCDVEIGGTTFCRVAIRPKGNTSLTSIASDPTTDRYSFKLEFDHYVDGQTCFGLDKLILNNNYADATNMKEALIYDMYQYLGADASLYNYAKLSVNGEYWGVYLALEAVEDSFLLRNYGVQDGELYKPDSMNIGGGKDFGDFNADDIDFGDLDLGDMTPPAL